MKSLKHMPPRARPCASVKKKERPSDRSPPSLLLSSSCCCPSPSHANPYSNPGISQSQILNPVVHPLGPPPPHLCPLAASMLLSPFSEGNCDWEQGTGARLVCRRRQTPPAPQAAPIYPSHIYNSLSVVAQRQPQQHTTHTHTPLTHTHRNTNACLK